MTDENWAALSDRISGESDPEAPKPSKGRSKRTDRQKWFFYFMSCPLFCIFSHTTMAVLDVRRGHLFTNINNLQRLQIARNAELSYIVPRLGLNYNCNLKHLSDTVYSEHGWMSDPILEKFFRLELFLPGFEENQSHFDPFGKLEEADEISALLTLEKFTVLSLQKEFQKSQNTPPFYKISVVRRFLFLNRRKFQSKPFDTENR